MNEQFDRALRNHIRDTFDHYDDLMADDGWKKFKKQKNRRRGLILWYTLPSGIAAALALLWIFNMTTSEVIRPENNFIAKNKVTEIPQTFKQVAEKQSENSVSDLNQEKSELVNHKKKNLAHQLNEPENIGSFAFSNVEKERNQIALVETHQKTFSRLPADYIEPSISFENKGLSGSNTEKTKPDEYLAFNTELLKGIESSTKPIIPKEKSVEKKKKQNFNFAVDANTYYSFTSAGVNNDLNMGIGVLSELKLSKHLSVNSGISVNKQSAIYQNSQQHTNSQSFDSPASPNALVSSVSKQSISVPNDTKTNAKLVGFDIPINLKYNISMGKTKTFVSTGISSYSLLNQSYANDVSVINYSLKSAPTTTVLRTVEEEKDNAFSNFQFARTINFSFGILYPLSTKNSISVEPFVKYPIAGFGRQDLEIGSGGISFKLNFGK